MSDVFSSYSSVRTSETEAGPQQSAFGDEYPTLLKLFRGQTDDQGNCVLPPCSISLFWEGDAFKYCLSPKTGSRVCFGTVSDASKGLAGVEQSLVDGHFEWKQGKKRS